MSIEIKLKPADEIRFLRQIKESTKQYNILSVGITYSVCDLLCYVNNYVSPHNSDVRSIIAC